MHTFRIGISKSWEPHERLPSCSMRTLLSRFLDITTPPSRQILTLLSSFCESKDDETRLRTLANVTNYKFLKKQNNFLNTYYKFYKMLGSFNIRRLETLAFTAFTWSTWRISHMSSASIFIGCTFNAATTKILLNFIVTAKK